MLYVSFDHAVHLRATAAFGDECTPLLS
jgi:hypothetical protein